jgi:lipoprotein-anchoring transpeptidase ErfK/SrfK
MMTMTSKRKSAYAALFAVALVFGAYKAYGAYDATPPAQLDVDLSDRVLKVLQDGKVIKTYDVAVGRPSYPTPPGSYKTGEIQWNPSWTPPDDDWAKNKTYQPPGSPKNPLRGVKIYFRAPAYYIHGTDEPQSIGEAASHGCIRMKEADAVKLAKWIEQVGGGVPLLIHQ